MLETDVHTATAAAGPRVTRGRATGDGDRVRRLLWQQAFKSAQSANIFELYAERKRASTRFGALACDLGFLIYFIVVRI